MHNRNWARSFVGGMSTQAILDYLHLWQLLANVHLSSQPDRTMWRWTANGDYTARSAYRMPHSGSSPLAGQNLVWNTRAPLKVKIFLWASTATATLDRRQTQAAWP